MTTEPPYLGIAAELRRRVLTGELSPGDRVPSTRAITREWGVAMATATKALAVLRREGLVRPEPGVGTVVTASGARAGAVAGTVPLSRGRVVEAALGLADTEGLHALTMRRVATVLGVSTMSLYRHVPGKPELVRLMTDAACGEAPLGPVPADWRTGLEQGARWLRGVYARHPWLAHAMASFTRPVATPNAMAYTEWVLRALRGTPLTAGQKLHTHLVIFAFVQGLSMADDLEEQARQDSGISDDEWMEQNEPRFDAIQSAGSYPELASVTHDGGFGLDLRTLFEFGLGRTLDGIAAMIDETSG
ncbi:MULTISPECIES: TetR/AcrR family transcriptional regulator C-terminal domain-containing protein [unclassified Streptomyces]|uniref:TetR/AcrR family transcriptional regulator C-terminal domain-containing protein n=1 Tax=unclassified Streptomyces TaxID=2593676 RepID=UPI0006FD05C2|nr:MULTISPECIES: TetR/AcrR family transcriptional regulator C-terminal domain-containing protein [unclassified Streptomyces]KQX47413.1 GntR family transcriptional regulator [Streptomyces sp. Root1304]KRA94720.1 GntR family transcriptional regulator [Streptomyces sp. Root66D1]